MSVLKEIEQNKTIFNLKYDGESIWPVLRLKTVWKLQEKQKGTVNITRKFNLASILVIIKNFFYGFGELFKLGNYDFFVFSGSERRKRFEGLYHERVVEGLLTHHNALLIENPYPLGKHYPKGMIPTKHIISESILFVGVMLLGYLYYDKNKLEGVDVLKDIFKRYDYSINYKRFLIIYQGQYRLVKLLLRHFNKPKAVFFVYAGSSMGYIKAFKEHGVPVVEIQHGVINREHNAYNVHADFGRKFFPDYLLTYGKRELEVFENPENYFIAKENVLPVGYYILDRYLNNETEGLMDRITAWKNQYKKIVVYTHQEVYEKEILDFLIQSAALSQEVLYLLIPRNDLKETPSSLPENLIVQKELNIYDCLRFSDIHATIYSTCAIESLSFGVPNIMYNYKNWSKSYYIDILGDENHTLFVTDPKGFVQAILNHTFESKEYIASASDNFFKRGNQKNINDFIETQIER